MVVETVVLEQIDDIEFVHPVFPGVAHVKLEPLSVAPSVVVGLQDKVLLVLLDLDGSPQVATFKSTFEDQGLVLGALQLVLGAERAVSPFLVEHIPLLLLGLGQPHGLELLNLEFHFKFLEGVDIQVGFQTLLWVCLASVLGVLGEHFVLQTALRFDVVPLFVLERTWLHRVLDQSVHECALVGDPVCFLTQTVFEHAFIRDLARLQFTVLPTAEIRVLAHHGDSCPRLRQLNVHAL